MIQAQQEDRWPLGLQRLNRSLGLARSFNLSGSISFSTLLTSPTTSSSLGSFDLHIEARLRKKPKPPNHHPLHQRRLKRTLKKMQRKRMLSIMLKQKPLLARRKNCHLSWQNNSIQVSWRSHMYFRCIYIWHHDVFVSTFLLCCFILFVLDGMLGGRNLAFLWQILFVTQIILLKYCTFVFLPGHLYMHIINL